MSSVAVNANASDLSETTSAVARVKWIDIVKGLAILAVLAHHYTEPPLKFVVLLSTKGLTSSTLSMWHLACAATTNKPDAVLVWIAGLGYQGVHVFLIASGFGLMLAEIKSRRTLNYKDFLRKRAARLLPPYWLFVALLGAVGAMSSLLHWHPEWLIGSSKSDLFINALLLRDFSERWVWIYPGALWFVPLIVELYLLYPLVASFMKRSPTATLVCCGLITLLYRAFAVLALDGKPVGIEADGRTTPLLFCLARLFEFAFGMWVAQWLYSRQAVSYRPSLVLTAAAGTLLWLAGMVLTCSRLGFILGDPLLGVGLFLLFYVSASLIQNLRGVEAVLSFFGQRSYSLFLMHSLLIPTSLVFMPRHPFLVKFVIYCLAATALGLMLDGTLAALVPLGTKKRHLGLRIRHG